MMLRDAVGKGLAVGEDGLVELSDAIEVVREQLITAQTAGRRAVAGRVLTFAVGKVSIEFSGEVKKVAGAGGGVKVLGGHRGRQGRAVDERGAHGDRRVDPADRGGGLVRRR